MKARISRQISLSLLLCLTLSHGLVNAAVSKNKSAAPKESFQPYFAGGGVIGNGGDELKLVPDDKENESDTIVTIPEAMKNYGYVRIDGARPNEDDSSMTSYTLSKCIGGMVSKSGHFSGPSGACNGQKGSFTVSLNEKQRIPPGLYLLSAVGESTEESTMQTFHHPAIIRIEARKTTVVPIPRIVLPNIPGDIYVDATPELAKDAVYHQLIFSEWHSSGGYENICSKPLVIRQNAYIWNWKDEDAIQARFRKSCALLTSRSWKNIIPHWKRKTPDPKDKWDKPSFLAPSLDTDDGSLSSRYGRWVSFGRVSPGIIDGLWILAFPGIYRLQFTGLNGIEETKTGVVVGGFNEEMIGKVFPR